MALGLRLTAVLCLTIGLCIRTDANCPNSAGWSQFGGRWYKFFNTAKTWSDAEAFCTSVGGHLAPIENHDMYKFIRRLIFKATHAHTNTWVGGTDAANEGKWLWIGGEKFVSVPWALGEPNGGTRENCMDINLRGQHYINDESCTSTRPFVCVRNKA